VPHLPATDPEAPEDDVLEDQQGCGGAQGLHGHGPIGDMSAAWPEQPVKVQPVKVKRSNIVQPLTDDSRHSQLKCCLPGPATCWLLYSWQSMAVVLLLQKTNWHVAAV